MRIYINRYFLVVSGALILASCGENQTETKEETPVAPLVELETVKRERFQHSITVQGNVQTDEDVTLSAEMGGLITLIPVKEGKTVQKGQVIAQVDASVLGANLEELNAQLEYAEYMLSKQEELNKQGLGTEMDLETARNQVQSLKASMNSIDTQRGKAVIRAPFTGVVDKVFARRGQVAGAGSPLVRLVNNDRVDIVADLSEKHLSKVRIGTPLKVRFPNYSDDVMELTVSTIGKYIEPTNRTFRIMAHVEKNEVLLPNMLAEVSITDMDVENGLVIPSKSVLKDRESNDYIFIATPEIDTNTQKETNFMIVKKETVKIVERSEGMALLSPNTRIKEGQLVVVAGARGISDGDRVRTDKRKK